VCVCDSLLEEATGSSALSLTQRTGNEIVRQDSWQEVGCESNIMSYEFHPRVWINPIDLYGAFYGALLVKVFGSHQKYRQISS